MTCPTCHGKGASTHDINGKLVEYCDCPDEVPSQMERLLAASIAMVQKDQRIAELEGEVTLLRAQLAFVRRQFPKSTPVSMFHRRQAE